MIGYFYDSYFLYWVMFNLPTVLYRLCLMQKNFLRLANTLKLACSIVPYYCFCLDTVLDIFGFCCWYIGIPNAYLGNDLYDLQYKKLEILRFFGTEKGGVVGGLRFDFCRAHNASACFRRFYKHFFKQREGHIMRTR